MVLEAAHLNTQESSEFFQRCGQKYITLYPQSPTLLKLFDKYASLGSKQRIYSLFIWLNLQLSQELLEQVLKAARLTVDEKGTFLENYGEFYISRYPQSKVLLNYVRDFLAYLPTINIDRFKSHSSLGEPSPIERFLRFIFNSP